jgi:hypothetical protein
VCGAAIDAAELIAAHPRMKVSHREVALDRLSREIAVVQHITDYAIREIESLLIAGA